jgi:hypothetical protein
MSEKVYSPKEIQNPASRLKVTIHTIRPNLNPYNDWAKVEQLKKSWEARLLRSCLDSVGLVPLVRNTPLYRKVLDRYNRCIDPSRKPNRKKHQCIVL